MKRTWAICILCLLTSLAYAEQGDVCSNAIPVDVEYSGICAEGEYWFTADTWALPLTFYYYPEDVDAPAPEIWLDLTCTPGVYDDPAVAEMLQFADKYGLSFPMQEIPEAQFDEEGRLYYSVMYDRNYRDMLYNQGVTYAIPAYVRLVSHCQAMVSIVSKSINSQCRDYVNTLGMNTELLYAPSDSVYIHLWPIGEWIKYNYKITWSGEGKLDFYDGITCKLNKHELTRDYFSMPDETIVMTPERTSAWIKDIYQTDLYVRLYAESEGILKIAAYEDKTELSQYIIAGIEAAIDMDTKSISATLPAGTNRKEAIKAALITFQVPEGSTYTYAYNTRTYNTLTFTVTSNTGQTTTEIYSLRDIVESSTAGNTDATLAALTVDGYNVDNFSAATLRYDNIEVTTAQPHVEAVATKTTSSVEIWQAQSVPGTATVIVTAEAGNTQTYVIQLIAGRSKDASLQSVFFDGKPLESFSPEQYNYRLPVSHLPQLTAQATDAKAVFSIEQAKGIPGFAQVRVTAEAGNVQTYTFNFVMDERFEPCLGETETIAIDKPVILSPSDADKVLNIPIKDWTEQMIRFIWSGNTDLVVYMGTSCFFDVEHPDETLVDSFVVALPVGETIRHYDFRPAELKALSHLSLDGTLYLRFSIKGEGDLLITDWEENCLTQSTLIMLPSETAIPVSSFAKYRFYLPDWQGGTVRLTWRGESACKAFVADACDFYLTDNNIHVLHPAPYTFAAGEGSWEISSSIVNEWNYATDDGFLYMRFINSLPGTLTVAKTPDEVGTSCDRIDSSALSIEKMADGYRLSSVEQQDIFIFGVDGRCVKSLTLMPDAPLTVRLPLGVYILKSFNGIYKLMNN
ncbi:MAG: hypothetical protein NC038_04200 [Paludibacter sp.]|nr:hypothetical protein [Bacteroidales bacterium]MCM1069424.1 hypothetical protein [Prevotella sp.]MCM1353799.1 hypothetical protein [Bacteroides sp.]MCM1442800.1 hypothetical protein [Muribaculum sp.]MCM1481834.1 hypothetical protein [Paludibacter sp.]